MSAKTKARYAKGAPRRRVKHPISRSEVRSGRRPIIRAACNLEKGGHVDGTPTEGDRTLGVSRDEAAVPGPLPAAHDRTPAVLTTLQERMSSYRRSVNAKTFHATRRNRFRRRTLWARPPGLPTCCRPWCSPLLSSGHFDRCTSWYSLPPSRLFLVAGRADPGEGSARCRH